MSRAPVSVCFIFRDDPLFEQAFQSVAPYVAQVCVRIDEDAPAESFALLRRLVNDQISKDTGLDVVWDTMVWRDDFALARNSSFKLATMSWVSWADTDDVVEGAENLAREIARIPPGGRLLCPYDYGFDPETGEVTRQQWRERVVANDVTWHWEHPTHEGLVKRDGHRHDPGLDVWAQGIKFVHKRTEMGARGRSLAILREWSRTHDDPWTHLNLGLELHAAGEHAEAIEHYKKHYWTSGWAEERAMSALRAADCALSLDIMGKAGYREVEAWIDNAVRAAGESFETYFTYAKLEFMRATMLGDEHAMGLALKCCRRAVQAPETRTPIGRNPQDRTYSVWDLMRNAAETLEQWDSAIEATEEILRVRPKSPPHVMALKKYRTAKMIAGFGPQKEVSNGQGRVRGEEAETQGTQAPDQAARAPRPATRDGGAGGVLAPRALGASGSPPREGTQRVREGAGDHGERGSPAVANPGSLQVVPDPAMPRDALAFVQGGRVVGAAKLLESPFSPGQGPLVVSFVCGPAPTAWNPEVVKKYGAGGSETAVVEMASRLARMGHRVTVYGAPGLDGTYEDVDYVAWTPELRVAGDVAVCWRVGHFLTQSLAAKVRLMWCHDVTAIGMDYGVSLLADRFLALSKWHKDNLVREHGIPESQVFVTRNGIDVEAFRPPERLQHDKLLQRDKLRALYVSSPDRGLGVLLDLWPEIYDKTVDALRGVDEEGEPSLDIYYSFDSWKRQADASKNEHHRFLVSTLQRRIRELDDRGYRVKFHGMVSKQKLADAMMTSGSLLFPTWFSETNCLAVQEARAAGMRVVTSPIAALLETVGDQGSLVSTRDGRVDWVDPEWQAEFVEEAVDALRDDPDEWPFTREEISGNALRTLGWQGVAEQWDELMRELVRAAETGALPEYAPEPVKEAAR